MPKHRKPVTEKCMYANGELESPYLGIEISKSAS